MNYLKKYNLSDIDIKEIIDNIDENDYFEYTMQENNVSSIIEYLLSIGIVNIKELLMDKGYLFHEKPEVIRNIIKQELVPYINTDITYLDEVGI